MNRAKYYTMDVFTEVKYGGNQLAVFPDATSIHPDLFQKIARELNLSETVFLFPPSQDSTSTSDGKRHSMRHSMRIFTPMTELPTAGHPTLGTAFYLAGKSSVTSGIHRLALDQKIGTVEVEVTFKEGEPDLLTMYQPLPTYGPMHNDMLPELAKLLSIDINDFDSLPVQEISCGNNTLILPLKSTEILGKIKFSSDVWESIREKVNRACVYTFTKNGVKNADVQGRMFGPEVGIYEDPATGSANGPLICYLTKHKILSPPIISLQGYEMGRPSQLYLDTSIDEQGNIAEVRVGGKCIFTGEGELYVDSE